MRLGFAIWSNCQFKSDKQEAKYEQLCIVQVGMILDTVVDHRKSEDHSCGTQNPCRDEYTHVAVGKAR